MLEFLAKELGFTVFGIGASYAECVNINDYVLHGKGDRSRALTSQGFWTWDTEEVLGMIDWIREYNMSVAEPRRIKFYGFDFQQHSQAAGVVLEFLKKVSPALVRQSRQAQRSIGEVLEQASRRSRPSELNSTVHELIGFMQKNRSRLIGRSSEEEFEKALTHARMLAQFVETEAAKATPKGHEDSAFSLRDKFMAENVRSILNKEGPGERMVLWGHNTHISNTIFGKTKTMGAHLREAFGKEYYALGFGFYQGSFRARQYRKSGFGPIREFTVGPASEKSAEWYFAQTGIPNFIVDFRLSNKSKDVVDWLQGPLSMRNIGAVFSELWEQRSPLVELGTQFDGIAFVKGSTPTRPNPTRERHD